MRFLRMALVLVASTTMALSAQDAGPRSVERQAGRGVVEAWSFVPDLQQLRRGAETVRLSMPDGTQLTVRRNRFEDRGKGDALWVGRVDGQPDSQVLFTI